MAVGEKRKKERKKVYSYTAMLAIQNQGCRQAGWQLVAQKNTELSRINRQKGSKFFICDSCSTLESMQLNELQ